MPYPSEKNQESVPALDSPAAPEMSVPIRCLAYLLLALAGSSAAAQEEEPEAVDDQALEGYPAPDRLIGGPTDVDTDLATSFPKPDSVFGTSIPKQYFRWKEQLYEDHGVKLAFSYQSLFQRASETRTGNDNAWGGWMLLEAKWEAINRGKDFEGSVTLDLDWRHTIGGNANPATFGTSEVGSLWPTDVAFFEWDPSIAILYWEQWLGKDTLNVRVGKQLAANTFDFFRFKDARTSFSATPFTAHNSIPAPAFGQALSFKWWPKRDSSLYVHGTLNDMNGDPESFGLDTFFQERQYFYGLELGYFWRRGQREFDHVHLDLFYADEKSTQPAGTPNEPGGGFKVLGSKQLNRFVTFGSYTYNTAEGGGLGATLGKHTVTAGGAYLKPLGVRGEVGLGTAWMDPVNTALEDQFGGELYWKLLLTPDLWVTPGVQAIWNPSLNPAADFVSIAQIKLRFFL